MRFTVAPAGADLRAVYIGFLRLDDLSLMRKVTAASPDQAAQADAGWLLLIGLFAGALLSAFAYNLLIYTGQGYAFQRWYLVWLTIALAYGLTWTNALALLLPGFVGPDAFRAGVVLVGAMIGAGNMFLVAVLEPGMSPRWLRRTCTGLAIVATSLGVMASAGGPFSAATADRWFNYAIAACAASAVTCIGYALRRGSRTVWFYLAGWSPVFCVFALRLARNLGLLPQDDLVDMATFGSIAFESIVLSLAIADRFRLLRRERDEAEQAHHAIAIESETLRRAAHTDFLTGLGNRAGFHTALQTLIGQNPGGGLTLFLIDVDHLKAVNDRLGHDGGDALLSHVGMRLRAAVGPDGHVARIGGDEFAILLPTRMRADEDRLAANLDALQDERKTHGGRSWTISLSIGSARFPDDVPNPGALYKAADLALYHAKRLGRRRRCCYDPSLRAMIDRRAAFINDAYAGLARNEFSLHYQPIVDLESFRVIGHEALLRWEHPAYGMLTPAIFGDILTESKIGELLQSRVLALALTELQGDDADGRFLSVNFTVAQLCHATSAQELLDQFARAGVPAHSLSIELTEGIVLEGNASAIQTTLHRLHDAGVRIALDDFGTGYASLIHIRQLPIDTLKVDRSFLSGLLDDDGQNEEIVRAIVGLGKGLHKAVVAEGIETEAQLLRLRELGCRLGQGYLFARPGPERIDTLFGSPTDADERRSA